MQSAEKSYVSAAGRDWLLPFFDLFTKLLGIEGLHRRLIDQAAITAGQRVLEIGSGTGNLTILAKDMMPAAHIVGIDPDPKAVSLARRKALRRHLALQFDEGFSEQLPYPDTSFDRLLSAFMLHHVKPGGKPRTLREAFRVLKPGGSLHLADFEGAGHPAPGLHGLIASKLHSRHGSSPHHVVLNLMGEAGFADCQEIAHQTTIMGRVVYYRALRPHSAHLTAA